MKRFSYLFMAGLMTLGLGACSDEVDVSGENGGELSADKVYMSFKLELPKASRSATDEGSGSTNSNENPDYEVGQASENTIQRFDVVLTQLNAAGGYDYITQASNATKTAEGVDASSNPQYTVSFESQILEKYVGKDNIYVFVFCNHPATTNYKEVIENSLSYKISTTSKAADISTASKFWMANAKLAKANSFTEAQLLATSEADPFNLGTVEVERTAARFDYKAVNDNKYDLGDEVQVELKEMALVNMSNNFYYLRHVVEQKLTTLGNPSGMYDKDNVRICIVEDADNFVVDSDAEEKLTPAKELNDNFEYYWSGNNGAVTLDTPVNFGALWNTTVLDKTTISSLTSSDAWGATPSYKIWRYATENTMPSIDTQIKAMSTGVLFRGILTDAKTTGNRLEGTKAYVYNNQLLGSWTQVEAVVNGIGASPTDDEVALQAAYNGAKGTIGTGEAEPTSANASAFGFTVYEKDTEGNFPVFYYYLNRHNDNGNPDTMGVMEFAVVRNNVYKLSVTSINKFGHPGDPTADPDPEIPLDPDESDDVYFEVDVKVLPWVVRVNDIEF